MSKPEYNHANVSLITLATITAYWAGWHVSQQHWYGFPLMLVALAFSAAVIFRVG